MQVKTAVLLGATGLTGNHLLHLLLADDYFTTVRVLVRKPFAFMHPRLEVRVTDFDDHDNFHNALGKGDVIFCCTGTTMKKVKGDKALYRRIDFDIPVHAAQWGIDNGFSQYLVVSAIGANAKSSNFYLHLKGSMEAAIHALPYRSLHIFHPSLLLGSREEKRKGEKLAQSIMPALSFLLAGSLKKYRAIEAPDVAKAMLAAAKSGKTGINVYEYAQMKMLLKQ
ncbi:NAD(P)H-binding protein [Agriterribacter sp.]|uniref:NAD(P)H-binding protein n=1 Tax=Agriterribacter sp. TaxID=2821509 RepID=UPI002C14D4D7|nr:NAD(P)H-binding protein [Agriterribacter sp.]HTN07559.1 NAD(P)H-binding protein [Agriterribacter sp.]